MFKALAKLQILAKRAIHIFTAFSNAQYPFQSSRIGYYHFLNLRDFLRTSPHSLSAIMNFLTFLYQASQNFSFCSYFHSPFSLPSFLLSSTPFSPLPKPTLIDVFLLYQTERLYNMNLRRNVSPRPRPNLRHGNNSMSFV